MRALLPIHAVTTCKGCVWASSVSRLARVFWNGFGHGIASWSPYQLRHAAGARARREFGLGAAQALLGHKTVSMAEYYSRTWNMS